MRTSTKIIVGIAFAGLVAAGSSALTGTGLSTSGGAAADQFVGGSVSQAVTGATLTTIAYGFTDETTKTAADTITLTFANTADGKTVAATPSGNTAGGTFTCGDTSSNASSCTYTPGTDAAAGYTGLTGLSVAVN